MSNGVRSRETRRKKHYDTFGFRAIKKLCIAYVFLFILSIHQSINLGKYVYEHQNGHKGRILMYKCIFIQLNRLRNVEI